MSSDIFGVLLSSVFLERPGESCRRKKNITPHRAIAMEAIAIRLAIHRYEEAMLAIHGY